ncbi:adhesion G protein-coupled receptor E2-like [Macrobrachium nipponense]|uniref:adhesion G protein-coupled receptor E2-like n=1 Tax=Macrobrachium nipponense TaxID=159736 RepID=UPI0030C8D3B1
MRCQNTHGSYECICNAGFEKVNGTCVDINECTNTTNPCGPNSVCSNSPPGSFSCKCNAGFVFCNGTCVDTNECDSNPCPANTLCQNTDGSYQCICPTGFTNQTGSCVDVNECNSSPSPCTDLEKCINTPGNYSCVCQKCSRYNPQKTTIHELSSIDCHIITGEYNLIEYTASSENRKTTMYQHHPQEP